MDAVEALMGEEVLEKRLDLMENFANGVDGKRNLHSPVMLSFSFGSRMGRISFGISMSC